MAGASIVRTLGLWTSSRRHIEAIAFLSRRPVGRGNRQRLEETPPPAGADHEVRDLALMLLRIGPHLCSRRLPMQPTPPALIPVATIADSDVIRGVAEV